MLAAAGILLAAVAVSQEFVSRRADTLLAGGVPWYFQGANAYVLPAAAARGDTAVVEQTLATFRALGLTVLRTWAFHDGADSSDPAVIQSAPGRYHESGLRGLDFVVASAARNGLRLILPLVNSWDDYGGMNQYVRWRAAASTTAAPALPERIPVMSRWITGNRGQRYLARTPDGFSHDLFYSDSLIGRWYEDYVEMVLTRVNSFTGVRYRDDPTILAWELANEPRSSDPTGNAIRAWVERSARRLKSVDPLHLLGTGEEGFDVTGARYSTGSYSGQSWMFDGSSGVSFAANLDIPEVDFASIHLYPDSWNLPANAGNTWIRDHIRIARSVAKPLVVGEYGLRGDRAAAYDSWLTTVLLDGGAGAVLWQLGNSSLPVDDGYVVRCDLDTDPVCAVLRYHSERARQKSGTGALPSPAEATFLRSYPNPCRGQAVLRYTLAGDATVSLTVFTVLGERIAVLVDGDQGAGERRELFDGRALASGTYVIALRVRYGSGGGFAATGRMVLLR